MVGTTGGEAWAHDGRDALIYQVRLAGGNDHGAGGPIGVRDRLPPFARLGADALRPTPSSCDLVDRRPADPLHASSAPDSATW